MLGGLLVFDKKILNNKKILLIPPLFHENRFIIDFKEKAELFNSFITNQYSLLKNAVNFPHISDM